MQPQRTDHIPSLPPSPPNDFLLQKIGRWLGRLWSLCTLPFELIKRVTRAAFSCFSRVSAQEQPPPNNSIPSPKKFKKEELQEEITEESKTSNADEQAMSLNLDNFFYDDREEISDQTNLPEDTQKSELKLEPANPQVPIVNDKPKEEITTPKIAEKKLEPTGVELRGKPFPQYGSFRRRARKQNQTAQGELQPPQPLRNSKHSIVNPTPQSATSQPKSSSVKGVDKPGEPIIIEAGGAGNCQALSILKGLEFQYPEILQQYQTSNKQPLDAKILRKMGVDFAREQLDKYGKYVEEVLGYLDADRKEHNNATIAPVERNMEREKNQIETAFKNKKISQEVYEKRKKVHHEKYSKQITQLEAKAILTDADFLDHLEKNGFQCSTLHLFALSIQLGLPIYVHEQYGIKNHDIHQFNPTDSTKAPIHLYRVANMHYQYMIFPNDIPLKQENK